LVNQRRDHYRVTCSNNPSVDLNQTVASAGGPLAKPTWCRQGTRQSGTLEASGASRWP